MKFLWELFQTWSGFSLFFISLLPLFGFLFLSKKERFNWVNAKGINSHISLYTVESAAQASASAADSRGGSGKDLLRRYTIQQVSASSSSSSSQEAKLSLVAKMPLQYLDSSNYWEYCLPTNSPLKKSATQTTSGEQQECSELKNYTNSSTDQNIEKELLDYLLKFIPKYIQLQHQINTLFLFHWKDQNGNAGTQAVSQPNQVPSEEEVNKVWIECGVSTLKTAKFRELLFTPDSKTRKCVPFPFLVELYLKVNKNGVAGAAASSSGENFAITLEKVKQGEIWGMISYGVTDYWNNLKYISSQKTGETQNDSGPALFKFPLVLNYALSGNNTKPEENKAVSFDHLWKKYTEKSLVLGDVKKER